MNDIQPSLRTDSPPRIPDLPDVQRTQARAFIELARRNELEPVLSSCVLTPRIGFTLIKSAPALALLNALAANGWSMLDFDTRTPYAPAQAGTEAGRLPDQLYLFRPLVMRGRMIHGATSGLTLTLVPALPNTAEVRFADKRFGDLPVNTALEGACVRVSTELIEQLAHSAVPQRVDIVYTWVDDTDPGWQAKRRAHSPENPSADAEDKSRFESNNELLYSLRSLFRYFTGIGKVYLVTDGQTPAFLDEFQGRVTLVDHDDIMGPEVARPCFNSHVIESCLHRIAGLSEYYLYLNDDFLFAKPSCPADFFDTQGRSKVFFSRRAFIPKGKVKSSTLAVDAAAINLRDILKKRFDFDIHQKFQHTPVPIRRDVMFEIEEVFAADLKRMRKNQFRARNDLSPSGSLYLHYAVMQGVAVPSKIKYRYYDTAQRTLPLKLMKLSSETDTARPNVHCINATGDKSLGALAKAVMHYQLSALYPDRNDTRTPNTRLDRVRHGLSQLLLGSRAAYRRWLKQRGQAKGKS